MFAWAREQFREHGADYAAQLIVRVAWSRAKVRLANKLLPATRRCPCCGWTGRRFYDYIEVGYTARNSACPQCDSHARHRAFYVWLREVYRINDKRGAALVFAPEPALVHLWEEAAQLKLIRVDIANARGIDLLANLESLPIASDSMDLIWCHHVLEHVEHDHQAINELQRVLRPQAGELIVSVPMELGTATHEYGFADPHMSGHWRMYGDDFADRLAESGLTVEECSYELSPEDCRRFGITPDRFFICRKNGAADERGGGPLRSQVKDKTATEGGSSNEPQASASVQSGATLTQSDKGCEVSVVIPVRNEERSLPELIASLKAQTIPPAEVVIVDGGSTDETVALARRLTAGDGRFRVVEAGKATPGRGRNIGITTARHEWIALTDAGNQLEPQWLERLLAVVQRDPAVAFVYGNFEPIVDSFFSRCASLAYIPPKQARPGGLIRAPFIASSLVRRDAWRQVGGFPDLRAAEDLMFMEAIERQGYKIGWAPEATAWWHMQQTLGRTYRRFEVYSRCNVWAGRQRFWHYGIARQYLFALIFVVLAVAHSPWWLCVVALGFAARVGKRIWRRREGNGLHWLFDPIQFLGVAVIILTVDLATFVGWSQTLWQRPAITTHQEAAGEMDL